MTRAIPRALVADALGADEAALPPGDLPLDRFAARFIGFLRDTAQSEEPDTHPDAWTYVLFAVLAEAEPARCLAAIRASLAAASSPEEVALIAAGPLEELLITSGAEVIDEIEALAATAPRLRYALTGVWPPETGAALLWARVRALQTGPQLDDGAPLPPADNLA